MSSMEEINKVLFIFWGLVVSVCSGLSRGMLATTLSTSWCTYKETSSSPYNESSLGSSGETFIPRPSMDVWFI